MKNLFLNCTALLCLVFSTTLYAQDLEESPPTIAGERTELRDLFYANLTYPAAANKAGISGDVLVTFTISPAGQILNLEANAVDASTVVPATAEEIVIMSKAAESPEAALAEKGRFALQAESLMVMQRIQRLPAKMHNGVAVASRKEVLFRFVLE